MQMFPSTMAQYAVRRRIDRHRLGPPAARLEIVLQPGDPPLEGGIAFQA